MPGRRQLIFYIYFLTLLFPGFRTPSNIWQPGVQPMSYTHIFSRINSKFCWNRKCFEKSEDTISGCKEYFLSALYRNLSPPACPNNGRLLFNYKFDNPTDGREREWVSPAFCPCEFSILSALGNTSILKVSILVSILAELDWGEGLVFTKLGQG